MNTDELRAALLDLAADHPVDLESARTEVDARARSPRRRSSRQSLVIAGAIALVVLVAAGVVVSGRRDRPARLVAGVTTVPRASTVPASTVDPAASLSAFVASRPNAVVQSGPAMAGDTQIAVVGIVRGAHDHAIEVEAFSDGAWGMAVSLSLPEPSFDFATDVAIETADATGDGRPDFLVTFLAGDHLPGAVVSDDSGAWRVVPLSSDPNDVYAARDPMFVNAHLETVYDDCTPDCATGHNTIVVWRYERGDRRFHRVP